MSDADRTDQGKLATVTTAHYPNAKLVASLSRADIEALIAERPPALMLDSAIILQRDDQKHVVSLAHFDSRWADGHYPHQPMIPLAAIGFALTQAASVLVAHASGLSCRTLLQCCSADVRARMHHAMAPETSVYVECHTTGSRLGMHHVLGVVRDTRWRDMVVARKLVLVEVGAKG